MYLWDDTKSFEGAINTLPWMNRNRKDKNYESFERI